MEYRFVITATIENAFRVVQRVASVAARHRLRVLQLQIIGIEIDCLAHLCLVVQANEEKVEQLIKQLKRMVDCSNVNAQGGKP